MSLICKPLHRAFVVLFVCLLSVPVPGRLLCADESKGSKASEKLDAVLLLDSSGSMLLTDPQRLRDQGARLFTQFLKPEDRLAIVSFADKATVLRPLVPYNPQFADEIESSITRIDSSGSYTDLLSAIRTAKTVLAENPRDDAQPIIVLLSDGKMDPDPQVGSQQALSIELLNVLLPELKSKGIKIYTLAFSEQADKDLLASIALGTDGINWYTDSVQTVHKSYADLFLAVKKPQMVPLTSKGFQVDENVQEATFYISRNGERELEVMSPSGLAITPTTKAENVRWFKSDKFDVITVLRPEVGNWKISGLQPEEGFATILTNIKLLTEWPSTVTAEEELLLEAQLYESDKPVSLPEVSGVSRVAFQITPTDQVSEPIIREFLHDDGTHGDRIAKDGVFSSFVTIEEAGEYKLRVIAQTPTFQRTQQLPFRVKPPLIKLFVANRESEEAAPADDKHGASGHDGAEKGHGEEAAKSKAPSTGDYFVLELSEEASQLKGIEVKLLAISDKRLRYYLPLTRAEGKPVKYEVTTSALPHDGGYELEGSISGVSKTRKTVKFKTKKLSYDRTHHEAGGDDDVHAIVIEGEKPPEPEKFPWLSLLVITLTNVGFGTFFILTLKKALANMATNVPVFEAPTAYVGLVEELKARSVLAEVDLNDSFYTSIEEPNLPKPSIVPGSGAGSAAAPAAAAPAPEAAAAPEAAPEAPAADGDKAESPEEASQ